LAKQSFSILFGNNRMMPGYVLAFGGVRFEIH